MNALTAAAREATTGRPSNTGGGDLSFLMSLHPDERRPFLASLPGSEVVEVMRAARRDLGTTYGVWQDDPVGFTQQVLRESLWSKQTAILTALTTHKRVVVPSAVGMGKTHIAARAVAWTACCWPVGTSETVTIATRMRQVERQLWPHIRRLHARADLPGDCGVTQWKMDDRYGVATPVAYGFTAPAHDEAAMQGIHALMRLMLVVDEAGGIDTSIGRGTRNLLTGDAVGLFIGNPATDDENTWFEEQAAAGLDPDKRSVTTIEIPAASSPAVTGEYVRCLECPRTRPAHSVGRHMNNQEWIDDTIADYGEEDPYVVAKVHAKFPRGGSSRAIPSSWVDAAVDKAPDPDGAVLLRDLGLDEETRAVPVALGAWIRLGVDVAADGGDEMAITRAVGDVLTLEHTSAGPENENAVEVSGMVLRHIRRAEQLRAALGTNARVRVKVDGIGVGWGVASILTAWGKEGLHDADIVAVVVSEKPKREPDSATMRPLNQRAEMWLAGRSLLQPDQHTGYGMLRLAYLDHRARAQLSGPKRMTNSGGFTVIEPKKDMKKRGVRSPDRAESALLAIYEPSPPRKKGRVIV